MTITDIQSILMAGGSIHVDAKKHTRIDLQLLALVAGKSKGTLYIDNSNKLNTSDMLRLSMAAPGHIVFCNAEL